MSVVGREDMITVLEEYLKHVRGIRLVGPKRRFAPARLRQVTDFLAQAIARRI